MLAIAGGKGGCGKTTTTLRLATDLARRGRDVLAVDADRDMPDLHALAGVPNDPTVAELASDDDPDSGVASVARPVPGHPGVAVLPAAPGVGRRELRRVLRRLEPTHRATLVDCPSGTGLAAVDPIRVAEGVLVVTTPSPASLRDATKTAAIARAVGTPVVCVAVTRTDAAPPGIERAMGAPAVALSNRDFESPFFPDSAGSTPESRTREVEGIV